MTTDLLPNQMPFRYFKAQPSAAWTWLIWIVSVLFALFQFFLQLSSGVMVNALMHSFAIGAFAAGLLASSYYYIYSILQTPAGMLIDKFGVRYLLTGGSLLCGASCILFALSPSLWLAFVARLLMGTGSAFAFIGSLHLIREWFDPKRFAFMVGLAECIGMAGTVIFTIFLAVLLNHIGWRECMILSGFIALTISILCWLFVYENPARTVNAASSDLPFTERLFMVLRLPKAWINGLYCGLQFSVVTVFSALWAVPYLIKETHLGLTTVTTACTMVFVGAGIGAPIMGYISETLKIRNRTLLMSSSIVTALIFAVIIYLPSISEAEMFGLMLLLGLSCSSYVLNFAIANDIAPPQAKNTCLGFTNALCVVIALILQPIIGALLVHLAHMHHGSLQQYGLQDYREALTVMPIVMLLAAGLGYFL